MGKNIINHLSLENNKYLEILYWRIRSYSPPEIDILCILTLQNNSKGINQ